MQQCAIMKWQAACRLQVTLLFHFKPDYISNIINFFIAILEHTFEIAHLLE